MSVFRPSYIDKGKRKESEFWWIDFTISGKRVRESAQTTRKTIAIEFEKRRRVELERANAGLTSQASTKRISSVAEMVKAYLAHYHINHRPKSVIFAKQRLAHVTPLLGPALLPDLTEDRIKNYISTRLAENAGGRTINMELGELSRAIGHKWSALWPKVRKLEENHNVGQALSAEEEIRLLRAAAEDESPNRNPALYPILCIALSTGMRGGEIASLRWSNVNLDGSLITVGRAKSAAGTGRQIPINSDLVNVLDDHARWYKRVLGEVKSEWHVFPGRSGKPARGQQRPLDPKRPVGDITTAWDALRETAAVQCRFHDLRHTAATKMAEAGVPESTMLAIMGHMSRAMLERYSHIRMAAKREAVKSLEMPKGVGPRLVSTATTKERQSHNNAGLPKAVSI